eukprot:GHRQ01034638.1.p2 GENE.GHRQ01034638.1~~GHRQ01034638.1.p2  ORF type:complete len:104 (-),score=23.68 GHRQ01034638.1:265-576(-)
MHNNELGISCQSTASCHGGFMRQQRYATDASQLAVAAARPKTASSSERAAAMLTRCVSEAVQQSPTSVLHRLSQRSCWQRDSQPTPASPTSVSDRSSTCSPHS